MKIRLICTLFLSCVFLSDAFAETVRIEPLSEKLTLDGKLTENYVSPVVMSGSVPELLKSITMISDDFEVIGAGSCGKGYKEWVKVSDGGPCLKVKVKLA